MVDKFFIEIEGTDCSGKQTQAEMLEKFFKNSGFKAKKISFPAYNCFSSGAVEKYLSGKLGDINSLSSYVIAGFYISDRIVSYLYEWKKDVEENDIIIFDRYVDSNLIYQFPKFKSKEQKKEFMTWNYDQEFKINGLPMPNLKIYLKTPPHICEKYNAKRDNKINGSKNKDIHETNIEYLYNCYESISLLEEWDKDIISINTVNKNEEFFPIEEIMKKILQQISAKLIEKTKQVSNHETCLEKAIAKAISTAFNDEK